MPSKRRLRNGSATAGKSVASLAAAAIVQQRQQQLQQQQAIVLQQQQEQALAIAAASKANGAEIVAVESADGEPMLTQKQQQQLDRNRFLSTLTKDQLRFECRKRGQKTSGNKTELLQRLGYKMTNTSNAATANNSSSSSSVASSNNSTVHQRKQANGAGGDHAPNRNHKQSNGAPKTAERERERTERESLVVWRKPLQTTRYATSEIIQLLQTNGRKFSEHQAWIYASLLLAIVLSAAHTVDGWHTPLLLAFRQNIGYVLYWVGLGVISSVGLGTGLHTFLLYLGPHIASVTLAAYECNSLDFPQPPYPDEIICPEGAPGANIPTLWAIMSKVRLEAFLWGAGTALGELPPYFMAKAARLSGYDPEDDDDLKEFEELQKKRDQGERLSPLERAKIWMERIVERVGFLGILACASVPNPLFDLAGITCGHFLVPFWTFFGATLIGKAIIKMHIQKVFVIIAFNETLIQRAVDLLVNIPVLGAKAQEPFKAFLANQKARLHRGARDAPRIDESGNVLAKFFELFVGLMVLYFVVSIVNSLAQSHHKRLHKQPSGKARTARKTASGKNK